MSQTVYELTTSAPKRAAEQQFPLRPAAIERVLARYAIAPEQVVASETGIENQTFLVTAQEGAYVLRVYRYQKKTTAEIELELAFESFLAAQGLAVPRVMANVRGQLVTEVEYEGRTWQAIVMERMPGQHQMTATRQVVRELARVQAQMHQLGAEFGPVQASYGWRQWLRRGTGRLGLAWGYRHFDLTTHNVLWVNHRISAVLDFDDMTFGPLVTCLANTLTWLAELPAAPELIALYLSEYQRRRPLGRSERTYLTVRLLAKRRLAGARSAAWLIKAYRMEQ